MESSREDQIMELFNEMAKKYEQTRGNMIYHSGLHVDKKMNALEEQLDGWRARMTKLVYGKDKD